MWFFLLLCAAYILPTISQDDGNKVILKGGTMAYPCEGHAEVFHKGKWGYVGDKYWNEATEETLCRNTHCGKPVSRQDVLRDTHTGKPVWLNEVVCKNDSSDLTKCSHPGWSDSFYSKDTVKKVKCSKKIDFSLHPFRCAGAVMYNTSEGDKGYFCGTLKSTEANLLCENLNCGQYKEVLQDEWIVLKDFQTLDKRSINCPDIQVENLWQCNPLKTSCKKPVSVICTGHKTVRIKGKMKNVCSGQLEIEGRKWNPDKNSANLTSSDLCKQLHCGEEGSFTKNNTELACKKKVEVVLMAEGVQSTCYGEVHFKVNDRYSRVCGSSWTKVNAEVVCKELKCGGVVSHLSNNYNSKGMMDNVQCSGQESSLWHCMAKRSDDDTFSCSSGAYVVCAGSIDVRLEYGPGKCAGRVQLLYEGQWQGVAKQDWTDINADAVCTHLECGKQAVTSKANFSHVPGNSLKLSCKSSASAIADCGITKSQAGEKESVGIICEEHKVLFLEYACSGKVGIERADKTSYWLSGSSNTWNKDSANMVCHQMHCGEAVTHTSISSANMMKGIWHESYNCSSNLTSLFECEKTSSDNRAVASVHCSENISVSLTGECWGYVNVCTGGKCDGVCTAAWTEKMSQMLCANLSCGEVMTSDKHTREQSKVIFKSMHMTEHTTSLSQCNLVKKQDEVFCEKAFVVCKGSVKVNFNVSSSRYKCSGKVEMHHEGQWLPVCKNALENKKETQKIICGELNCGQPVELVDYIGPRAAESSVISKIECSNGNMSSCSTSAATSGCTLGHLRCSSWGNMELKFGNACSGEVFVHSGGNRSHISSEGWTETASKQLCKDLKCGELKSNKTGKNIQTNLYWKRNFNCDGVKTPQNIWDCEKDVLVTSAQPVLIECQDEPNVTLSEDCHGEVRINNISVCHSHWKHKYSDLICQEQNCGNAVPGASGIKSLPKDVESYRVTCEEYHHKLGQCNRYEAKCKDLVYVYCSKAVKFNTTEKCGGEIQVIYGKTKEFICSHVNFSPERKKKLCDELKCNGYNDKNAMKNPPPKTRGIKDLKIKLQFTEDNMDSDINRWVTKNNESCNTKPAWIYCKDYKSPQTPPPQPDHTLPIFLGLGFLLIVMILIIVFVRIRMARKAKRPMSVSSRTLPGKEVEYESGEYEPVTDKENEMDVFSNDRFRTEAEVIMESDARSASSYDDVDQVAESRPLTSPALPAGASGDSFFGDGALNQNSDGVTYEVEDPQENYDDIEASPESIQTKAEVHNVPEPAPESVTVATPAMVQGEEDYLVPGQDR